MPIARGRARLTRAGYRIWFVRTAFALCLMLLLGLGVLASQSIAQAVDAIAQQATWQQRLHHLLDYPPYLP